MDNENIETKTFDDPIDGAKFAIEEMRKFLINIEDLLNSDSEEKRNKAVLSMIHLNGQMTILATDFETVMKKYEEAGVISITKKENLN